MSFSSLFCGEERAPGPDQPEDMVRSSGREDVDTRGCLILVVEWVDLWRLDVGCEASFGVGIRHCMDFGTYLILILGDEERSRYWLLL